MNRLRYKKISIILMLALMFLYGKSASADVIYTPIGDSFYDKHQNQCKIVARSYTANAKTGSVNMYESPNAKKSVGNLINGTQVYISVSFEDSKGVIWGSVERLEGNLDEKSASHGWAKLSEFKLVYDKKAFLEEHEKEFKEYQKEFDEYEIKDLIKDQIVIWEYPGAESMIGKIKRLGENHRFILTYTDVNGRLWGGYSYYQEEAEEMDWKQVAGFICISDPNNPHLPPISYDQGTTYPPNTDAISQAVITKDTETILIIAVQVLLLLIVTAILIRVFWRKKKSS